jgi:hypothetical protein
MKIVKMKRHTGLLNEAPYWSPDGSKIVFSSIKLPNFGLIFPNQPSDLWILENTEL